MILTNSTKKGADNHSPLLLFRTATEADLTTIIALLADDMLGAQRESAQITLSQPYRHAFDAIQKDENNELIVATDKNAVVGVFQLTFLPSLTYQGGWRAQIEGVRVAATHRGQGLGKMMILHAIERAKQRKCRIVQLTTDKKRVKALHFYQSLGFNASHEGMKLHLIV